MRFSLLSIKDKNVGQGQAFPGAALSRKIFQIKEYSTKINGKVPGLIYYSEKADHSKNLN